MAGNLSSLESTNVDVKSTKRETQARFVELMAERVRELAVRRGFNAKTLGGALEIPSSSAANYWSGKRAWPTEVVPELAAKLATNVETLMRGTSDNAVAERQQGYRAPSAEITDDLVEVVMSDVAYGMGGALIDELAAETTIERFPRSFIRQFTKGPFSSLYFAVGIGDSMSPTIHHSDLVLIDRSQEKLRVSDQLWAVAAGEIGMIKRVRVLPDGSVLLVSDNPDVSDYQVGQDELHLIGRVVAVVKRV